MKPNLLAIAFKNTVLSLNEFLPFVLSTPPTLRNYLKLCDLYRRLGCACLLMGADPKPFYTCLFRSSRAYASFLEIAPEEEKATGRSEPLYDAIACRDHEGALQIAQRSPDSLNPKREYDEDFLCARFIIERFVIKSQSDISEDLIERFAVFAAEFPDPRFDVCRALMDVNQNEFDDAIESLISVKLETIERSRSNDRLLPDEAPTTARLSTEVLSWLELGERAGLKTRGDYRLAPEVARLFHRASFPATVSWRDASGFPEDLLP